MRVAHSLFSGFTLLLVCFSTFRSLNQGAENRARSVKEHHPGFDLYVGMEGGLEEVLSRDPNPKTT